MFWTFNVDKILHRFTRAIDNLEAAIEYHNKVADLKTEQAVTHQRAASVAVKEADRAGRVAAKLRKLLEVD